MGIALWWKNQKRRRQLHTLHEEERKLPAVGESDMQWLARSRNLAQITSDMEVDQSDALILRAYRLGLTVPRIYSTDETLSEHYQAIAPTGAIVLTEQAYEELRDRVWKVEDRRSANLTRWLGVAISVISLVFSALALWSSLRQTK